MRLAQAYKSFTSFLKQHGIEYIPVNAGLYVFAKLAPDAKSWEDEAAMIENLKKAGVLASAGKAYHVVDEEKGWARLTFAIDQGQMIEALRRIEIGLQLPVIASHKHDL